MQELNPRYNPSEIESKIYKLWEDSGYFNPDNLKNSKKSKNFCIIMPPPNANGALHMGHAVFVTLQDILIRFWRMKGFRALWLPGADHAGFETQVVFDKKLEKEGKSRFQIPADILWEQIWNFTQENKKIMEAQLKRLGASCDWSREKFTLDKDIVKVVYETFKKLYDDGLIYRKLRVVNWCTKHQTALSDLEVKYVTKQDPLYYIKYGPLTLATVRPETKFGDTALAVNPKDKRYQKYIGKEIEAHDVLGKIKIKVIADSAVDPNFGTGVVKVTPAHDPADFEIWERHKDEIPGPKIVIDEDGRLTDLTGPFKGLKTKEAREKIVEEMKHIGILEKIEENYTHQVATCYKCGTVLEPIPKMQWWIKMESIAKNAENVIKSNKINFYPKHSKKVALHWLKNIRDWNISRQIAWGIRIPVWYCKNNCKPTVSVETPKKCAYCGSTEIYQEKDVFDTWFSSGQWPFATLMTTPKNKPGDDFKKFYPTDVMETGYDILFFWVLRMIMLGLYRTKKIPFKNVYLHGMVRDKDRQKMSKSKGNVIDPLGVAETYGVDAVRMALIIGNTAGNDIIISEEKIKGYRNFATKVWNIARFILMHKSQIKLNSKIKLSKKNQSKINQALKIKKQVENHLKKFEFHLAGHKVYHYIWHNFADKIIEESKKSLYEGSDKEKQETYFMLESIFIECLKMLHPFMPFITEEIYQKFFENKILMAEKW